MRILPTALAACAVAFLALPAAAPAEERAWHATLEKGVDAAKKSGRAVFLVTIWKTGL